MVDALLGLGAELLKPKKDGTTIMHVAAANGDVYMLDLAIRLKKTASVDMVN